MEIHENVFSLTFVSGVILMIIYSIVLLKKSKIERVLLNEEQKILVHSVRVIFLTLIISTISLQIIEWLSGEKFTDVAPNERIDVLLKLLYLGLMISVMIYFYVPIFFSIFRTKTRNYFIQHPEHGKLYIIKFASKNHVLLSSKSYIDAEDGIVIFEKKDSILSTPVYCEVEKYSLIKELFKKNEKFKETLTD